MLYNYYGDKMKIFIGCSSRDNIPSKYYGYCKDFLNKLFEYDYDLVFGASNHGLMGLCYDVSFKHSRNITGIYPDVYEDEARELSCIKIPVKTVSERTDKLIEQSDVLVFLPGGIGTIYELFTAIESKRAMEHKKPIIIYNCCDFYNNLFLQLDKIYEENFTSLIDEGYFYVCSSVEDTIKYLNGYKDKVRKG